MKFEPIFKEKVWGGDKLKKMFQTESCGDKCGEVWVLSALTGNDSLVSNGHFKENTLSELCEIFMDDLIGDKQFEKFQEIFPLLIKFIDTSDYLSVQVHPNDAIAKKKHNVNFGKSEMWYVIDAEANSQLFAGFSEEMNRESLLKHIQENTVQDVLQSHSVKAGDVLYIPAGLVHAIGSGVLLAEIQQSSDITYRLYDWNRGEIDGVKRELHINDALDAIDYSAKATIKNFSDASLNKTIPVVKTPYFNVSLINLEGAVKKNFEGIDSFVVYVCLSGKCSFVHEDEAITLSAGECILIPAITKHIEILSNLQTSLLEVYI